MVEPPSYRWLNTSNNSSAPVCESGTYPSSSIIRSLYPASCRCRPLLVASLQQFMDESCGGVEANRQSFLAGREAEPETDVRLSGAAIADRDDVLPAGHILRAGELQHKGLVERRNGGEVEAVQALHGREPRLLDPTLHHEPFAVDKLQFGQAQEKADVIKALGGALPGELVVLAQERRQLERLQVMSEQKLGRIGHDAALVSRPRYVLANVIATWTCGRYG